MWILLIKLRWMKWKHNNKIWHIAFKVTPVLQRNFQTPITKPFLTCFTTLPDLRTIYVFLSTFYNVPFRFFWLWTWEGNTFFEYEMVVQWNWFYGKSFTSKNYWRFVWKTTISMYASIMTLKLWCGIFWICTQYIVGIKNFLKIC